MASALRQSSTRALRLNLLQSSTKASKSVLQLDTAQHGNLLKTAAVSAFLPRAAVFHSSARRHLLPPLPERINGTVNDPVSVHPPSPTHGSYHWTFERLISLGLIPLMAAPFVSGSLNPITDALLCAGLLVHSHIGFTSIIIDYVPQKRMPRIRKLFTWGQRLGTVLVGIGLYEFETNDVGLTETFKRLWKA